jgi:uncharacterized OB-fold protein
MTAPCSTCGKPAAPGRYGLCDPCFELAGRLAQSQSRVTVPPTKTYMVKPEHEIAYQEIVALVRRHAEHLEPVDLLAVTANALGKILALQDQRTLTPDMAMEVIKANLERGNAQALEAIRDSLGSA